MWKDFNANPKVLNPTWVDPWFEHEIGGIFNGPSTGPGDPAYEMTQNLYGCYNWFQYKEYGFYAATAMMTSAIQESTITGGCWEAQTLTAIPGGNLVKCKPYSLITQYDPTSNNATWYMSTGGICTWQANAYDEYMHVTVYLSATPGSWQAVKKYPILMEDVEIGGQTYHRPVYPLTFNTAAPQVPGGDGRGYGLCQWTPWSELRIIAGLTAPEGTRHWQLNLTLQLMVWEHQRYEAMHNPDQSGSSYHGFWVDSHAQDAGFKYNGVFYRYGQSMTWDQFAHDDFIEWVNQTIDQIGIVDLEERDNCRRQAAVSFWGKCYLHAESMEYDYESLHMQEKSLYIISAMKYWKETYGWDVKDIPRARDIPYCELDAYHTDPRFLAICARRRKRPNVRTVLL